MSRVTALDPAHTTGATKELLDQAKAALGAIPNMTRVMAHSTALQAYLSLSAAVSQGSISAATGERIGLGVAQANGCGYCLAAHNFLGKNVVKLPQNEIDSGRHWLSRQPCWPEKGTSVTTTFARRKQQGSATPNSATRSYGSPSTCSPITSTRRSRSTSTSRPSP
jgi:hypothetical protein